MATTEEISAVRLLIADNTPPYAFSDEEISAAIDANDGDLRKTSGGFWESKAARYSTMVDISEAGSSRKNSGLFSNAVAMAKHFGAGDDDDSSEDVRPSRTRAIRRA